VSEIWLSPVRSSSASIHRDDQAGNQASTIRKILITSIRGRVVINFDVAGRSGRICRDQLLVDGMGALEAGEGLIFRARRQRDALKEERTARL
jgi:hypothetical protein